MLLPFSSGQTIVLAAMIILPDTGGIAGTNCYLIADEQTAQAVLFDAPDHTVAALLDAAVQRNWEVVGLWLTHGHFDHIADHALVTRRFPGARVLIHRLDESKLLRPGAQSFMLPFDIPPRAADAHVEDGQLLMLGNLQVQVIHTPGHAPGHVMYHFPQQKVLVGGDLIIANSIGRTDLPDSNHDDLEASIRRVMQLPEDTQLLPGHGDITTLGEQLRINPFVRMAIEHGK
ncbi:MAG: MBL fold metallo-hydrolase [Phycisphaerales bacterium]|nr:MBL fold metallo-hydrolase [Phycisphaerales bacterium]